MLFFSHRHRGWQPALLLLPDGSARLYDEPRIPVEQIEAEYPGHGVWAVRDSKEKGRQKARLHAGEELQSGVTYILAPTAELNEAAKVYSWKDPVDAESRGKHKRTPSATSIDVSATPGVVASHSSHSFHLPTRATSDTSNRHGRSSVFSSSGSGSSDMSHSNSSAMKRSSSTTNLSGAPSSYGLLRMGSHSDLDAIAESFREGGKDLLQVVSRVAGDHVHLPRRSRRSLQGWNYMQQNQAEMHKAPDCIQRGNEEHNLVRAFEELIACDGGNENCKVAKISEHCRPHTPVQQQVQQGTPSIAFPQHQNAVRVNNKLEPVLLLPVQYLPGAGFQTVHNLDSSKELGITSRKIRRSSIQGPY